MFIQFHCSCGEVTSLDAATASSQQNCPRCNRSLALAGQSVANDSNATSIMPFAATNQYDAIELEPYYALAATPPEARISYRVVEVSSSPALPPPLPPPLPRPSQHLIDDYKQSARDWDDREVSRILAKARRNLRRQRWSRRLPLAAETNVWECLAYPFLLFGEILCLALILSIATPIAVLALPTPNTSGLDDWLPRIPFLLLPLTLAGVTWNFLRQVLRLSVMGDIENTPTIVQELRTLVSAGLMVVTAFVAGPALLLGAALWFWIEAGTLGWLDHVLLWQLWLSAAVLWVLLLLAVDGRGRLRDAQGIAIAALVRRQGWPAVVFALLGGASVTLVFYLSAMAWIELFDEFIEAFFLQFILWCGGLMAWTFLVRWYGMTRFWRRQNTSPKR